MTDHNRHHVTSLIELSDYCAGQLREFVKCRVQKLPQIAVLAATLKVCSRLADKQHAKGVGEVAARVSTYLQQRDRKLAIQTMEVEQLNLAAGWLEQLSRLHGSGLPWPQKQLADFQYSFDLLQKSLRLDSAVLADTEVAQDDSGDLFADDPVLESPPISSVTSTSDPFVGDPEIDPVLGLMQRTFHQIAASDQSTRSDPFADDESIESLSGNADDSVHKYRDDTTDVDVFAGDPSPDA